MSIRIFPTWGEINSFRNPLTEGERELAKYLDTYLPPEWEIFVQPFLNGDRPDIVILNKKVGLVIFEVKDWNFCLYSSEISLNHRNGKPIHFSKYFVNVNHRKQQIANPLRQVERYRENLINFYCPYIGESIDKKNKALAAFKVAIYMHNMSTDEAKKIIKVSPKSCTVFGNDYINSDNQKISEIVLDVNRNSSMFMSDDWYKNIRFWLVPPFHSLEQGQDLRLTSEQQRHVNHSPGNHQRLRGVAGSGKTLVLAQRAANIASHGKRVLVTYYNITLGHYIRDQIKRTKERFPWVNIEVIHFHGLCSNFLSENDIPFLSENDIPLLSSNDHEFDVSIMLEKVIPDKIDNYIKLGKNKKRRKYDAILIDEGQDFNKNWYDMLCSFLTSNDELFIVVDEKQNLYSKDNRWIDSMTNTRFRGRWRELKNSFRVPKNILDAANRFAETFLPEIGIKAELTEIQQDIDIPQFKSHYIWRNLTELDDIYNKIYNAVEWLIHKKEQHPSDIVVLVPTHKIGWDLCEIFKQKGFKINHVFEKPQENKDSKKNKKSFWMGDSRLKICTIHSFKGWEILNTILLTPINNIAINANVDYLIYTSITRTRMNIIVFNQNPRYNEYGKTWPSQW
jgi:hypothetical protein